MVYLRTAFKTLKKTWCINTIVIVQLVTSLVMLSIMLSSISSAYRYYDPFREYFTSNGLFVRFGAQKARITTDDPNVFEVIESGEHLLDYLDSSAESILSCHYPIAFPCSETSEHLKAKVISYEDEMINSYQPELDAGRWLNPNSAEIEVVISHNHYGWDIGTEIPFEMVNTEASFMGNAKVVGIIKDGTRIIGLNMQGNQDQNYLLGYSSYNSEIEEKPIILFSYSALAQKNPAPMQGLFSTAFIKYFDDASSDLLQQEASKLHKLGSVSCNQMSEINENSMNYIYDKALKLLPILIIVILLEFTSCISSSALATKRRLRDYAIYYICGLKWKSCILINLLQSLIICAISASISILIIILMQYSSLSNLFRIEWNMFLPCGFAFIFLIQIVFSLVIPFKMLSATMPKQILVNEKE